MEFKITLLFVIVAMIGIGKAESEPRCYSNFDFQEKLLEKMVILTNRMDTLEKALIAKQKEFDDLAKKLNVDKSSMENDISKLGNDLRKEVRHKTQEQFKLQKQKMAEMEKEVEDFLTAAKAQAQTEKQSQNTSMTTMEQKVSEFMTSSEAKIARLSVDVQGYINKSHEDQRTILKDSVKPNVAFLARSTSTISPGTNTKLIFTTTLINTDNCYSTKTGEFISPVTGTYWFSIQICSSDQKIVNFRIVVNDVIMSDTTRYNADNSNDCTTANTVAVLSAGNKVYVRTGWNTNSGNVIYQGSSVWSMFMGALVN